MLAWSDVDVAVRDAVRDFVDKEIRPHVDALESGEMEPYPIIRKLFATFGIADMSRDSLNKRLTRLREGGRRRKRLGRNVRRRRQCVGGHGLRGGQRAVPGVHGSCHRDGRQPRSDGAHNHGPWHARSAGALAAGSGHLRQGGRLGHHRAGLGLGRVRRHEVLRGARRRRLHPQRAEDLHHQRSRCRRRGGLREAGRGRPGRQARPQGAHVRA